MTGSTDNPWLRRFAWFTAASTLVLLCFGGLVTSHGAGMAVPDWPNTYGYNLFLFPISQWVGGIFYEHTHRLVAAGVGVLTMVLAVWLWRRESRRSVRWLGLAALALVVLQGVLGGLRVVLAVDHLGIVHAALAQAFFCLMCALAVFTTRWWQRLETSAADGARGIQATLVVGSGLILAQLLLGATMRHEHAGLAIPDFPLAYGRVWPAMDPAAVSAYNQQRIEVEAARPITAFGIGLHMAHRLTAAGILGIVAFHGWQVRRRLGASHVLGKLGRAWLWLVVAQLGLGAATVWSGKSADVATAHMAVGALLLAVGVVQCLVAYRVLAPARGVAGTRVQVLGPAPTSPDALAMVPALGADHARVGSPLGGGLGGGPGTFEDA